MLRRLSENQPEEFKFTKVNLDWAKAQLKKYPKGRQASAVIPLLWKAQEQEGWISKPAIEFVAKFLDMPEVRVLEVATFYFMFHLTPVGSKAHFQVCGTTPCMLRGSEDLINVCKARINMKQHSLSADGSMSWEEVECLGGCANAPVVQIGSDYFEDLNKESFEKLIYDFETDKSPVPGSRIGRFSSEPANMTKKYSRKKSSSDNASLERFRS
jgi:NADH-quinone oxidoreductase subunit E